MAERAGHAATKRRAALAAGRGAETWAAWALRVKGYRILARRLRHPAGEIDLIAKRGKLVAFVEVKARSDVAAAADAVSQRQRRRIRNAAEAFAASRPGLADCDFRFDLVLVTPGRWPRHIPDAWRDH
jgi:putative endonuclease